MRRSARQLPATGAAPPGRGRVGGSGGGGDLRRDSRGGGEGGSCRRQRLALRRPMRLGALQRRQGAGVALLQGAHGAASGATRDCVHARAADEQRRESGQGSVEGSLTSGTGSAALRLVDIPSAILQAGSQES